jgi:hypothetical protein
MHRPSNGAFKLAVSHAVFQPIRLQFQHAGQAGTVLTRRPAQLSLVIHGQIPLWRVQFRKLEEDEARAACAALFSAGSACIALPDDVLAETS